MDLLVELVAAGKDFEEACFKIALEVRKVVEAFDDLPADFPVVILGAEDRKVLTKKELARQRSKLDLQEKRRLLRKNKTAP